MLNKAFDRNQREAKLRESFDQPIFRNAMVSASVPLIEQSQMIDLLVAIGMDDQEYVERLIDRLSYRGWQVFVTNLLPSVVRILVGVMINDTPDQ